MSTHPQLAAPTPNSAPTQPGPAQLSPTQPLVEVRGLSKRYVVEDSMWRRMRGRAPEVLRAVDGVDLSIAPGEILGLVGESGSGKTTLGRCVLRLVEPTAGRIFYRGQDITALSHSEMQAVRRRMQTVFQNPYGALNPRMTVRQTLSEALLFHKLCPRAQVNARVDELLQRVGLPPDAADRLPNRFSGGQRQRIGIARAIAVQPEFIVADEPVSAVDVSIQAQVLNLLLDLKRQLGLTMLFIAHNLSVVNYISNRVGVMYLGRIVELGPNDALFRRPLHPYTQGLLLAAPEPDPTRKVSAVAVEGEPASPLHLPTGCRFHPRCHLAQDKCRQVDPVLEEAAPGHWVACHYWTVLANQGGTYGA